MDKPLYCPSCGGLTTKNFCPVCNLQVDKIEAHKVEKAEPYPTSGVDPKYWWIIPAVIVVSIILYNLLT